PRFGRQCVVRAAHLLADGGRLGVVIDGNLRRHAQNEDADDIRENHRDRESAQVQVNRSWMDVGRLKRDVVVPRLLACCARMPVTDISAHGVPGNPRAWARLRAKAASSATATRTQTATIRPMPAPPPSPKSSASRFSE